MAVVARQDLVIDKGELDRLVALCGKHALQMGRLNDDGSLSIPLEFVSTRDSLSSTNPAIKSVVEKVIETRKNRIADLTRKVQDAPSEAQAKEYWAKLEHILFGI